MRLTPGTAPAPRRCLILGLAASTNGGPMPRTLLTGLVLIGLTACGGGSGGRRARPEAKATAPAASRSTASKPGTATKRKTTARPDTTGQRNPLTDRKSTRLNSSHLVISYAVFCLKKKKKK